MSRKSERKAALKKQFEEFNQPKSVPEEFDGFSHDDTCTCNRETADAIEQLMIEFGFVEVPCKYEDHSVFIPKNFDTTCSHCRIGVWMTYIEFADGLFEAGLTKNFEHAYACIQEYVGKGPDSKCYFHPNFEETPIEEPAATAVNS
jgi:hypothetical protein